jgi:hypothetical protein
MTNSQLAIEQFITATGADRYRYFCKNFETEEVKHGYYTADQLGQASTIGFFRARNAEGYNIYARPDGYRYVLLDDLRPDVLPELAKLRPCALIETSPDNFQAWLILPDTPASRDAAKAICSELAQRFWADPASAEPDHVGRLPGFTNRKLKHRRADGTFPPVQLRRYAHRESTFHPCGGGVLTNSVDLLTTPVLPTVEPPHRHYAGGDDSSHDFGIVLGLVKKGRTDEQIAAHLRLHSPDLEARKGRKHVDSYIERTIRNVKAVLARS